MASFTDATLPTVADVYWNWQTTASASVSAIGGTVAVAATGTWGDINVVKEITSPAKAVEMFGPDDTPLMRAINDAFKGLGVDGMGGAGKVLAIRQAVASGGGAATKATRVLTNTASATALTLTAKKTGTRANRLKTTVQAAAGGGKELVVIDDTFGSETFSAGTDMAALAADITANSKLWDAAAGTSGTALADVSGGAVTTTGTDGATLTGTEWSATFLQLDRWRWNILAPYGLTDSTIRASIAAWMKTRNNLGQRSFCVFGGASGESVATANARSQALNDWNIVNLGAGSITRTDENNRVVGTSEMVARYAGARAFLGERAGDAFLRFAGCEIDGTNGLTDSEHILANAAGTTGFRRDTNEVPVYIHEAVTTYTNDSASPTVTIAGQTYKTHPVERYSDIKEVAIQHGIELEISDVVRSGKILGRLGNNAKSQQLILGICKETYGRREKAGILQPGWSVGIDGTPNYDLPYVAVRHGYKPTETIRQMFNTVNIGG